MSLPAFPLQPLTRDEMAPDQPEGSTVAHHTTVDMDAETPKDHIIWSLCSFIYGNPLCLGLVAFIYSIKARDRKMVGDLEGARHYGSTACRLNIVSTVLVSIVILTIIYSIIRLIVINQYI